MPCVVYESEYEIAERKKKVEDTLKAKEQAQEEKFRALKNHADKVTRLLCSVMGKLEPINEFTESGTNVDDIDVDTCKEAVQAVLSNPELQLWWKKHQKADRKAAELAARKEADRIRKENRIKNDEKIKARALSKLTKAERLALGIND